MAKKLVRRHKKGYLLALIVLGLFVVYGLAYAFHIGPFHKKPLIKTADQYTKGQPANSTTSGSSTSVSSSNSSSAQNQSIKSGNSGSATTTLLVPSGDFVSDHHPNLSSSPAPNTMTSVCNTTPGATCQITFTQGSIVKSLPTQTTEAGGSTYWNWKLQDYDLTAGSWQIQAIAKLNGRTETASDAMPLVVSP